MLYFPERPLYLHALAPPRWPDLEASVIQVRLFRYLVVPSPEAKQLDPACVVDLRDGQPPVHLWHDPGRWQEERQR